MKYDISKLMPFNLEKAKAGEPVCTRDGQEARIICFDRKVRDGVFLVSLLKNRDGHEEIINNNLDGSYYRDNENPLDLMRAPKIVTKWLNVYMTLKSIQFASHTLYSSEEEAKQNKNGDQDLVTTVKIEWEE